MVSSTCSKCGKLKPYQINHSYCQECRAEYNREWRERNPGYGRSWGAANPVRRRAIVHRNNLRRKGITQDGYQELLEAQGGTCAICGVDKPGRGYKQFCVDHDHSCCIEEQSCGECIRGLLCSACNVGLGYFRDSVESLKSAVRYLSMNARA